MHFISSYTQDVFTEKSSVCFVIDFGGNYSRKFMPPHLMGDLLENSWYYKYTEFV